MFLSNNGAKGADRAASASVHDAGGHTVTAPSLATTLGGLFTGSGFAFTSGAFTATLAATFRGLVAAVAAFAFTLTGGRPGLALSLPLLRGPAGSGRVPATGAFAAAGVQPLRGIGAAVTVTGHVSEGILDVAGSPDGVRGFLELSVKLSLSPILDLHKRINRVRTRGINKSMSSKTGLAKLTRRFQACVAVSEERHPDGNRAIEVRKLLRPHVVAPARRGLPRRCGHPRWYNAGLVKKMAIALCGELDPGLLTAGVFSPQSRLCLIWRPSNFLTPSHLDFLLVQPP